jgi:hypothetical protein
MPWFLLISLVIFNPKIPVYNNLKVFFFFESRPNSSCDSTFLKKKFQHFIEMLKGLIEYLVVLLKGFLCFVTP